MRYTQSICSTKVTGIECIGWGGYAGYEYAYVDGSFDDGLIVKKIEWQDEGKCWRYEVIPEFII